MIILRGPDSIIESVNDRMIGLLNKPATALRGHSFLSIVAAEQADSVSLILSNMYAPGKTAHREESHAHDIRILYSGSELHFTLQPLRDAGKVTGILVSAGQEYQRVKSNSSPFRNMVMQAPIGVTILRGPSYIVEMANEQYLKIVDRQEKQFVGKPLFDVLPEVRDLVAPLLRSVIETGEPVHGDEFKVVIFRQGEMQETYFNFIYQPLKEEDGRISGIIVVANEVTFQVKAKHALAETEKQFRNLVMQSPVAMTIWRGRDFIIEMANREMFTTIWRKEEEDIIGKKALDVFPELKDQKYPELLNRVLHTGSPHRENESVAYIQGDDGMRKFYLDFEYAPLLETDGIVSGIMITVNDVTEKVEARHKVEDAESRLRLATDGTGLATWDLDLNSRHIIYSSHLVLVFGQEPGTELSHAAMRSLIHPEDRKEIVEKAFEQAMQTGIYHYEARVVWPDKSVHWIRTQGKVIYDHGHKPQRMLGTMIDITNEKTAYGILQDSEQRLNMAIEAAELGTWVLNLRTREAQYSSRYLQILGFEESERPNHKEILERIHPGDRPARDMAVIEAMRTGLFNIEMRIIRPGNNIGWIKAKGSLFYDEKRTPERMLGTIMDITEQKAAFNSLQESEERFKMVADTAPVMIWMSGNDRFLDFFNTSWLTYTGRQIVDEVNDGWKEGLHPGDVARCAELYDRSFNNRIAFHIEYRLRRHDGIYRWISDNAVPRYTPDGEFVGFISACMDIDDEKRFNQRLQASELLFKTISNVSPVGLWMTNEKGINTFVNDTWLHWTGSRPNAKIPNSWVEALVEEDKKKTIQQFELKAASLEKFSIEFRFYLWDGSVRWGLSEGYPYYDTDGKFAGYAGSVTDITERKQDELLKNDFLAVASHELKTPITSIKAYTQLLARTYDNTNDAFLKSALSKVENQVNKMSKLVGDFLNLSKIESDKFRLNREVFTLNELVNEAVSDIQLVSPAHLISVEAPGMVRIEADREKIMQVLTNFLSNAVKYSPDHRDIRVIIEPGENSVTVSVRDKGIGIRQEEHAKIFQRFYRAESNNIQVSGFGIGLYISAEIINAHQGEIGVKSNKAEGSDFYFKLPVTG
ncbi:MAG TPA: PAS domain S-box protein [Chitinophagaceae bacterium]|nr:PAS domain S-box protein [Chitinophagaceae bacterium]